MPENAPALEVKVEVTERDESKPLSGRNVKVWGRVRDGSEIGEWFPLEAKYLEIQVVPESIALATLEIRAEVVEAQGLSALVSRAEVEY